MSSDSPISLHIDMAFSNRYSLRESLLAHFNIAKVIKKVSRDAICPKIERDLLQITLH